MLQYQTQKLSRTKHSLSLLFGHGSSNFSLVQYDYRQENAGRSEKKKTLETCRVDINTDRCKWSAYSKFKIVKMECAKKTVAMCMYRVGTWAVPFLGRPPHDHLARPKARHDTKYFGPCRHDTNTRAVPCLEFQHDGLYGTTRILGWHGTKTAHRPLRSPLFYYDR